MKFSYVWRQITVLKIYLYKVPRPVFSLKWDLTALGLFWPFCFFCSFLSANCRDFFCVTRIFKLLYHQWIGNPAPQRADWWGCAGQVGMLAEREKCPLWEGQETTLGLSVIFPGRTCAQVSISWQIYVLKKGPLGNTSGYIVTAYWNLAKPHMTV